MGHLADPKCVGLRILGNDGYHGTIGRGTICPVKGPQLSLLKGKTICSSVNRDLFIGTTSVQGSVYHAGILFPNGAGFWFRVSVMTLYLYKTTQRY